MILDKLLQFDPSATAITVTADSTNVLDMLNARDMGQGQTGGNQLAAVITVGTAFTAVGAGTLTIDIRSSADNITYAVLVQTIAIGKAQLTAGAVIMIPLPPIAANPNALLPRYYKLTYTVATGPFTAGTIEADLVIGAQTPQGPALAYPPGVAVSN